MTLNDVLTELLTEKDCADLEFLFNETTTEDLTSLEATIQEDKKFVLQKLESSSIKRSEKWSETDDIFLTGIVMTIYYERHSLKPTKQEKLEAKQKKMPSQKIIWVKIHEQYQVARKRFEELTGSRMANRSVIALQKRWKDQGIVERRNFILHGRMNNDYYISLTKKRERQWDNVYNKEGILSCSEENYSVHPQLLSYFPPKTSLPNLKHEKKRKRID